MKLKAIPNIKCLTCIVTFIVLLESTYSAAATQCTVVDNSIQISDQETCLIDENTLGFVNNLAINGTGFFTSENTLKFNNVVSLDLGTNGALASVDSSWAQAGNVTYLGNLQDSNTQLQGSLSQCQSDLNTLSQSCGNGNSNDDDVPIDVGTDVQIDLVCTYSTLGSVPTLPNLQTFNDQKLHPDDYDYVTYENNELSYHLSIEETSCVPGFFVWCNAIIMLNGSEFIYTNYSANYSDYAEVERNSRLSWDLKSNSNEDTFQLAPGGGSTMVTLAKPNGLDASKQPTIELSLDVTAYWVQLAPKKCESITEEDVRYYGVICTQYRGDEYNNSISPFVTTTKFPVDVDYYNHPLDTEPYIVPPLPDPMYNPLSSTILGFNTAKIVIHVVPKRKPPTFEVDNIAEYVRYHWFDTPDSAKVVGGVIHGGSAGRCRWQTIYVGMVSVDAREGYPLGFPLGSKINVVDTDSDANIHISGPYISPLNYGRPHVLQTSWSSWGGTTPDGVSETDLHNSVMRFGLTQQAYSVNQGDGKSIRLVVNATNGLVPVNSHRRWIALRFEAKDMSDPSVNFTSYLDFNVSIGHIPADGSVEVLPSQFSAQVLSSSPTTETEVGIFVGNNIQWAITTEQYKPANPLDTLSTAYIGSGIPNWLNVTRVQGIGPSMLNVRLNMTGLGGGDYDTTITVVSMSHKSQATLDAGGVFARDIYFRVRVIAPNILVQPQTLQASIAPGSGTTNTTLYILNSGTLPLHATLHLPYNASWVSFPFETVSIINITTNTILTNMTEIALLPPEHLILQTSVTVVAGELREVVAQLNGSLLDQGTYSSVVSIYTNVPTTPVINVPMNIRVTWISVCPTDINFAVGPTGAVTKSFTVSNLSPYPLAMAINLYNVTADSSRYPGQFSASAESFVLLPGAPATQVQLSISFFSPSDVLGIFSPTIGLHTWRDSPGLRGLSGIRSYSTAEELSESLIKLGAPFVEFRGIQVTYELQPGASHATYSSVLGIIPKDLNSDSLEPKLTSLDVAPIPDAISMNQLLHIPIIIEDTFKFGGRVRGGVLRVTVEESSNTVGVNQTLQPTLPPTLLPSALVDSNEESQLSSKVASFGTVEARGSSIASISVRYAGPNTVFDGNVIPTSVSDTNGSTSERSTLWFEDTTKYVTSRAPLLGIYSVYIRPLKQGLMRIAIELNQKPIVSGNNLVNIEPVSCPSYREVSDATGTNCICTRGYDRARDETCQACLPGRYKTSAGDLELCRRCPDGEYAIGAAEECITCPSSGAICLDGRILFETGSWYEEGSELPISTSLQNDLEDSFASNNVMEDLPAFQLAPGTVLHECLVPSACLRYAQNQSLYCAEGTTGPLCAVCEPGYASNSGSSLQPCQKCWSPAASWAVTILLFSILFGLVAFLSLQKGARARSEKGMAVRSLSMTVARIMVNWLQAAAILGTFQYSGAASLASTLSVGAVGDGLSLGFFPVQCALKLDFYTRLYTYLALPLLAILFPQFVALIAFFIHVCRTKLKKKDSMTFSYVSPATPAKLRSATRSTTRSSTTRSASAHQRSRTSSGDNESKFSDTKHPKRTDSSEESNVELGRMYQRRSRSLSPDHAREFAKQLQPIDENGSSNSAQHKNYMVRANNTHREENQTNDQHPHNQMKPSRPQSNDQHSQRPNDSTNKSNHNNNSNEENRKQKRTSIFQVRENWATMMQHRDLRQTLRSYTSQATTSAVVVIFLIHYACAKMTMAVFDLYTEPIYGSHWLRADMNVSTSDDNYPIAFALSVTGIFVIAIGVPVYAIVLLWANRHRLDEKEFRASYGFLYAGYSLEKRGRFLWEAIVLLRKIALAALGAFSTTDPLEQGYLALMLLLVALVAHLQIKPYQTRLANRLETSALVTLILTELGILYYQATPRIGITIAVILLNVVMLAIFIYFLIVLSSSSARQATRRILSCLIFVGTRLGCISCVRTFKMALGAEEPDSNHTVKESELVTWSSHPKRKKFSRFASILRLDQKSTSFSDKSEPQQHNPLSHYRNIKGIETQKTKTHTRHDTVQSLSSDFGAGTQSLSRHSDYATGTGVSPSSVPVSKKHTTLPRQSLRPFQLSSGLQSTPNHVTPAKIHHSVAASSSPSSPIRELNKIPQSKSKESQRRARPSIGLSIPFEPTQVRKTTQS